MNDIEETAEETSVKHEEEPAPPQNNYSRKCAHWLLFLSWLVYTVGSLGRMNYTASIVAIIWETGESTHLRYASEQGLCPKNKNHVLRTWMIIIISNCLLYRMSFL